MSGIVERLLFCADVGDMGRKPEQDDVYRVAADTITDLLAALESAEVHFAKFARTKFQHEAVAKMRAVIAKAKGDAA